MADRKVLSGYRFCLNCGQKAPLLDAMRNPWCEAHRQRCEIITWGSTHKWPLLEFGAILLEQEAVDTDGNSRYAVGNEYILWFTACTMGSECYINALHTYLMNASKDEVA